MHQRHAGSGLARRPGCAEPWEVPRCFRRRPWPTQIPFETRRYSPRGHCRATAGAAAKPISAETASPNDSARLRRGRGEKFWFIRSPSPGCIELHCKMLVTEIRPSYKDCGVAFSSRGPHNAANNSLSFNGRASTHGFQMRHCRPAECRQIHLVQRLDADGGGAGGQLSVLHHRAQCRRRRRARPAP